MPHLTINGKKFERINSAKVEITHGDTQEARQQPICQFLIELPADHDVALAEWALAPQGPKRWSKVELATTDREGVVQHTWTIQKAYCHSFEEVEFPNRSGSDTDQGNFAKMLIRGTLIHANTAYDGKNVLEIKAGTAEKNPG